MEIFQNLIFGFSIALSLQNLGARQESCHLNHNSSRLF